MFLKCVLLEKSKKLKNVLKKHYGPSGEKWKAEKFLQKELWSFWKKVNSWKMTLKELWFFEK